MVVVYLTTVGTDLVSIGYHRSHSLVPFPLRSVPIGVS